MKKRSRLGKGFIVIAFWVLGVAILMFTLAQVRDFAGIINDSGVVRGGTQRSRRTSQTPAAQAAPHPSATQGRAETERKGISV